MEPHVELEEESSDSGEERPLFPIRGWWIAGVGLL